MFNFFKNTQNYTIVNGTLEIPANTKNIAQMQFHNNQLFDTVRFAPNSRVKQIGYCAFYKSNLSEIEIPASVEYIGSMAFRDCRGLEKVTFAPNSQLKVIGSGAFHNTGISEIKIPEFVKHIEDIAFRDCKNLKQVTFSPNSRLKSMGTDSFYGTSISKFAIPQSVKRIASNAFNGCKELSTIYQFENNGDFLRAFNVKNFGGLMFVIYNERELSDSSVTLHTSNNFSYKNGRISPNEEPFIIIADSENIHAFGANVEQAFYNYNYIKTKVR